MSFGKTGSSDTWPLRHPHPTSQLPSHTGKFCPNVPRLMLIGILGTEQPLLLDTKCTHDTQVFQELLSGSPDAEKRQPC